MSRHWIAALALVACTSLIAFAERPQQDAPKGGPAPTASGTFVVTFELSKWDLTKSPPEQPGFTEHMKNVYQMAADGKLLVGGPLMDGADHKLSGSMMIVKAENAEAARKLCSDDALVKNDLMKIASVREFMTGAGAWITPKSGAPGSAEKK